MCAQPTSASAFATRRLAWVGPGTLASAQLDVALAYVAEWAEIREVLIAGGDPRIPSPRRIGNLSERLCDID